MLALTFSCSTHSFMYENENAMICYVMREASILYWHFVDVVWLFLFLSFFLGHEHAHSH